MGLRDRLFKKQDSTKKNSKIDHDSESYYFPKSDVFISYSTKDHDMAKSVCHILEQNNVKCWIAPRNIRSGVPYVQEIANAIKNSKIIVLIYSYNSNESKYVNNEIHQAFDLNKPIVAFKIDDSFPDGNMEYLLRDKHWLNGYPSPEDSFEPLVKDIVRLLGIEPKKVLADNSIEYEATQNHDVYIAYSSRNSDIARLVCTVLEQNGVECWIAPRNIPAGKPYAQEIVNAIKTSKIVVLIFSRYCMNSNFINNEIKMAFDQNKEIISLRVDDSYPEGDMEYLLRNKHWLDGYPSPERVYDTLVKDTHMLLEEPDTAHSDDGAKDHSFKNRENPKRPDIFISHVDADNDMASDICNSLEDRNVSCWLKERHEDYNTIIKSTVDAIKNSKLLILIFSKSSKDSNSVNTDVDMAFSYNIPILTFRIDDTKLEGSLEFYLNTQNWIDASSNFEKGFDRLIDTALDMTLPKQASQITLSTISDIVQVNNVIALSGTLKGEHEEISGGNVDIYQNGEIVDTVMTSKSGMFSSLISVDTTGAFEFKAIFNGDKRYENCESENAVVEVVKKMTEQQVQDALKKPFKAYDGDEPYLFVSYAHKDAYLVFPEIKIFHDEGYPVWYDQGLNPGQEWDDEVAIALINCRLLVVFISKNSMDSTNVQDEIKLALKRDINIVPIYFEETELPPGLELRLSNKHAIMKYNMNQNDYLLECFKAFNNENIPKIDFED